MKRERKIELEDEEVKLMVVELQRLERKEIVKNSKLVTRVCSL
jgi:hypothetical protein